MIDDEIRMKNAKRSYIRQATIKNLSDLYALLRRCGDDLVAMWDAGDWMHRYFGGGPAARGQMAELINALKVAQSDEPVSESTLYKCKQIRRDWARKEIEDVKLAALTIPGLNALLPIKAQANRSPKTRKAGILRRLKKLIRLRQKCKTAEWNKAVATLKRFCRQRDKTVPKLKHLKMNGKAAQSRVRAAIVSLEKMREYVPESQQPAWQAAHDTADRLVAQIQKLVADAEPELKFERGA